jgi:hypothetical protein
MNNEYDRKKINRQTNAICSCVVAVIGLCAFTLWTPSDDKVRTDEWVCEKKLAAISCSPYVVALIGNSLYRNDEIRASYDRPARERESTNRCPPLDPKNGNGCSHQQGSVCEPNYSKRKFLKTPNC